jgi:hypothetical protein
LHYSTGYRDGEGYSLYRTTATAIYLTHSKNSRELKTTSFTVSKTTSQTSLRILLLLDNRNIGTNYVAAEVIALDS